MVWSIQGGMRVFTGILRNPLKLIWGMLFMQSFLGSILILGWTNQLIRRRTLKNWWRSRPVQREDESFEDFIREQSDLPFLGAGPTGFSRKIPAKTPARSDPLGRIPENEFQVRFPDGSEHLGCDGPSLCTVDVRLVLRMEQLLSQGL